jgi:hypothetical protein
MSYPLVLELNTRCWLRRLSDESHGVVTLANVPEATFKEWVASGFTHLWLMGVWTTGALSRGVPLDCGEMRRKFDVLCPDWSEADVPGSPYAIAAYRVPNALGGEDGLARFKKRLNKAGINLMLDFVPNHMGLDHPWVSEKPDLFVGSSEPFDGAFCSQSSGGRRWIAHGKDPYFPPWRDVVQLDYRRRITRIAMLDVLKGIADKCDGVRCDMAMLQLNDIFAKTWGDIGVATDPILKEEFWSESIASVKKSRPQFMFLAESYWDTGARLQELGFDFTYHKTFLDKFVHAEHRVLPKYLSSVEPAELQHSAHFLENHDEPRINSSLETRMHKLAATLLLALPGMRMIYERQVEGAQLHIPVQFGRWPDEPLDSDTKGFYTRLLNTLMASPVGKGEWQILPLTGWPDNRSFEQMIVIQWCDASGKFTLVVCNMDAVPAQCLVRPDFGSGAGKPKVWEMKDLVGHENYIRDQSQMEKQGLYLSVEAYACHIFDFTQVN